jgi:hypothetical protein
MGLLSLIFVGCVSRNKFFVFGGVRTETFTDGRILATILGFASILAK